MPTKDPFVRILEAKDEECYMMLIAPEFDTYFAKMRPVKQPDIQDVLQQQVNNMYNRDLQKAKNNPVKRDITMDELLKQKQENYDNKVHLNNLPMQIENPQKVANTNANNNKAFWIVFDDINRKVILNDIFILAEPKPNSSAWQLISALIANPNKELNLTEICSGDIHAAYRDLGFQKGIKGLFLEVGKGTIKFINPVSQERFNKLENKNPIRVHFKEPKVKVSETAA